MTHQTLISFSIQFHRLKVAFDHVSIVQPLWNCCFYGCRRRFHTRFMLFITNSLKSNQNILFFNAISREKLVTVRNSMLDLLKTMGINANHQKQYTEKFTRKSHTKLEKPLILMETPRWNQNSRQRCQCWKYGLDRRRQPQFGKLRTKSGRYIFGCKGITECRYMKISVGIVSIQFHHVTKRACHMCVWSRFCSCCCVLFSFH